MLPKERTRPQRILSQHLRLFHLRIEGVSEATPVGAGIVVHRPLGPEQLGRKGLATAPAPRQDYSFDMSAFGRYFRSREEKRGLWVSGVHNQSEVPEWHDGKREYAGPINEIRPSEYYSMLTLTTQRWGRVSSR